MQRANNLKHFFKLTHEQYHDLYEKQNGKCGICEMWVPENKLDKSINHGRRMAVDHKGDTIRGLLCSSCNMALGKLGDDLPSIMKVVKYLTRE